MAALRPRLLARRPRDRTRGPPLRFPAPPGIACPLPLLGGGRPWPLSPEVVPPGGAAPLRAQPARHAPKPLRDAATWRFCPLLARPCDPALAARPGAAPARRRPWCPLRIKPRGPRQAFTLWHPEGLNPELGLSSAPEGDGAGPFSLSHSLPTSSSARLEASRAVSFCLLLELKMSPTCPQSPDAMTNSIKHPQQQNLGILLFMASKHPTGGSHMGQNGLLLHAVLE